MQITMAVLADAANVSREGKLNILGAFSNITANEVPARHPEMQLVLELEASPGELGVAKNLEVKMLDADGNLIGGVSGSFTFPQQPSPGQRLHIGTILRLTDVVFPKEGDYVFDVLIDGDSKKQVPLSVVIIPKEGDSK